MMGNFPYSNPNKLELVKTIPFDKEEYFRNVIKRQLEPELKSFMSPALENIWDEKRKEIVKELQKTIEEYFGKYEITNPEQHIRITVTIDPEHEYTMNCTFEAISETGEIIIRKMNNDME